MTEKRIEDLIRPSIDAQLAYYRSLGMRTRLLSLPVMVVAITVLIWRQVPSVNELAKQLGREGLLWLPKINVSQQALSARLLAFPAELFQRVFLDLLPRLRGSGEAIGRIQSFLVVKPLDFFQLLLLWLRLN